jgi:long-chain-alcohol oxidase
MGSARMGAAAKTSAFDTHGESWQVQSLYVADASAFPTALGVNPMVTVEALAYIVAQNAAEASTGARPVPDAQGVTLEQLEW